MAAKGAKDAGWKNQVRNPIPAFLVRPLRLFAAILFREPYNRSNAARMTGGIGTGRRVF